MPPWLAMPTFSQGTPAAHHRGPSPIRTDPWGRGKDGRRRQLSQDADLAWSLVNTRTERGATPPSSPVSTSGVLEAASITRPAALTQEQVPSRRPGARRGPPTATTSPRTQGRDGSHQVASDAPEGTGGGAAPPGAGHPGTFHVKRARPPAERERRPRTSGSADEAPGPRTAGACWGSRRGGDTAPGSPVPARSGRSGSRGHRPRAPPPREHSRPR